MRLTCTRFGELEFENSDVIEFPDGLIGFPELHRFVMVPHRDHGPFQWFQSADEPSVALLTANPWHFVPDYHPKVLDSDIDDLELSQENHFVVATATIPHGEPTRMTLNLAAPIVVNVESRQAKQIVLLGDAYTIKHRVFADSTAEPEKQAA